MESLPRNARTFNSFFLRPDVVFGSSGFRRVVLASRTFDVFPFPVKISPCFRLLLLGRPRGRRPLASPSSSSLPTGIFSIVASCSDRTSPSSGRSSNSSSSSAVSYRPSLGSTGSILLVRLFGGLPLFLGRLRFLGRLCVSALFCLHFLEGSSRFSNSSSLVRSAVKSPLLDWGQRGRVEVFFFGEEECRGVPGEEPRDGGDGVLGADPLEDAKSSQDKS